MNWIFGDNINTDLITPGRYNITDDPQELAKYVFIEYLPEFAQKVKKNDIIIAGNNFGCGSSRETAVMALKACGISLIIARSFSRIFFRNCLNLGILPLVADTNKLHKHDILSVDFNAQTILIKNKKKQLKTIISPMMSKLFKAGGIINFLRRYGLSSINTLFIV